MTDKFVTGEIIIGNAGCNGRYLKTKKGTKWLYAHKRDNGEIRVLYPTERNIALAKESFDLEKAISLCFHDGGYYDVDPKYFDSMMKDNEDHFVRLNALSPDLEPLEKGI